MTQRNEHLELAIEELERYGLKGEVSEREKHLELAWVSPAGRRFVIAPKTPSDWRGGMNLRSDLRKLLRADNLEPKPISSIQTSFQKAMSLPKPSINRELYLQNTVDALTDLVFDLQSQVSLLQGKMNSMRVVARIEFDQQSAPLPETKEEVELIEEIETRFINGGAPVSQAYTGGNDKIPFRQGSAQYKIADCLTAQFRAVDAIVLECQIGKKYIQTTLSKAKKLGYAENGMVGMWRRRS